MSQHVLVLLTTARLQDCPLLLIGVCCTGKSKRVGALSKLKTATVEVKENHHHSPQPQHTAIAAYTELTMSAFTAGCIPLLSFTSVTATKRQWCLSSWDVCRMCMMFRFVSGCVDFFLLTPLSSGCQGFPLTLTGTASRRNDFLVPVPMCT